MKILILSVMLIAISARAVEKSNSDVDTSKLGQLEAVLLIEAIHKRAVKKNVDNYFWLADNVDMVIGDVTCLKLLKADLIKCIKTSEKCISSVTVDVRVIDSANGKIKEAVVKYRGVGGNTDITYHFERIHDEVIMSLVNIAFLEVITTEE